MLDLRIRGGTVIDGTGGPRRIADLAVRQGRMVLDATDEPARRTVDADGLVVAPGFVDIHTHYDAQLFWDPTASPSPLHGVTTAIGGNCGFTLAPAGPMHVDYVMRMMARVEGMPLAALETGLPWSWSTFGEWLDHLDGGIAINAGFLCGHSTIRRAVMGDDAVGESARPAQIDAMVAMLRDALTAGALGFSTSTAPTHNDGDGQPVPSRWANREEFLALASAVTTHPGTTLELILAGALNGFTDDEVDLMTTMSLAAARPVNWNVLSVTASRDHEHQLEASDRAATRGGRIVALTLPHSTRGRLSFLSGFVLEGLPGWRETLTLPIPERCAALADPDVRARLDAGAQSEEAGVLRALANWPAFEIAETFAPANASYEGRTVGDIASERAQVPFDALLDIVISDGLRTALRPPSRRQNTDEEWELRTEVFRDKRTVLGGSDAGAHLDMMCGAVYTAGLLAGIRERGGLSVEEAVHQLSDVPARLYGIRHRGRIAPGWHADIVLFDPETVAPLAERTRDDLPGGASRVYAEATGIHQVYVNGVLTVEDGRFTGATSGQLLRSGRDTDTVTP
ncbi:MAG: aminoacylase [Acidimicrobiales bacterium]|jgi:N-acyl-D-aspartate/D-glutamate deacylase|nr:aminoacylase [Acidimicrobiales bacterium]